MALGKSSALSGKEKDYFVSELDPFEILTIWESHHGKLDEKWISDFIHHPSMERLTTFEFAEINNCLSQEKNLFKALEILIREYGRFQRDWDKWKERDYDPERDGVRNSIREKQEDIDIDFEF